MLRRSEETSKTKPKDMRINAEKGRVNLAEKKVKL